MKAWLSQHEVDYAYRNLIKDPLSGKEIRGLAKTAGLELSGLINKRSQVFKKMNVPLTDLDDHDIVQLIGDNPRILTRPLISDGRRILFRFNEKDYLGFIDGETSK